METCMVCGFENIRALMKPFLLYIRPRRSSMQKYLCSFCSARWAKVSDFGRQDLPVVSICIWISDMYLPPEDFEIQTLHIHYAADEPTYYENNPKIRDKQLFKALFDIWMKEGSLWNSMR